MSLKLFLQIFPTPTDRFSIHVSDNQNQSLSLTEYPQNVTVLEGKTAVFKCSHQSYQPVDVIWIRGKKNIAGGDEIDPKFMVGNLFICCELVKNLFF